jgi:ABC-type transport system substrate-binding protein
MMLYLRNSIGIAAHAGFIPAGLPAHDSSLVKGYYYDPKKAGKLLKEAGYKGEQIVLQTIPIYGDLGAYIAKQLEEVGLNVKVEVIQKSLLLELMATSKAPFFRGSWIADYPEAENYLSVLPDMDILAVWNHFKDFEIELIRSSNSDCTTVELRSLEPYYFTSHRWTDLLAGKKVLIISPFTDSIAQQIAQKDKVWPNKLLPDFSALYLKFPPSYYLVAENEQSSYPQDSQQLLDEFIDQIDELTYDIALIGAGLYSIPLATHCKDNNKVAIHLGGALQVLFGVKGKRWTSMSFINDYWVNPQPHETPQYKNLCEDGCYW